MISVAPAASTSRGFRAPSSGRARRLALSAVVAALACLGLCAPADAAYLYVANNTASTISQFSVGADGSLTPLSPATITLAANTGPQGIAVSPDGKSVVTGNFTNNTITRFTVSADTRSPGGSQGTGGTLSSSPVQTFTVTRGLGVTFSPDGLSLYVTSNRTSGFIAQFSVGPDGTLTPKSPANVPGDLNQPGTLVFNATGTRAYTGLNVDLGVAQYATAAGGTLSALTPATVPAGGRMARQVALSPDGANLYAASTLDNNVSRYTVAADGTLALTAGPVATGPAPRGIAMRPDGASVYVANSLNDPTGNSISQFTRAADGTLTPKSPATVPTGAAGPNAIVISSDGKTAYVSNQNSAFVTVFDIAADGTLSPKSPSLVTAGSGANALAFSNGPQIAPAATTGAASAITPAAASLAGTVNPRGVSTNYAFEYGGSLSFGQITPVTSVGSGSADVPVSATLTGLAANTVYYYRLVATSSGGTQLGSVVAFRTARAPQPFGTLSDLPTQTNGTVNAISQAGDRTYIAGTFTRVGVPIGFGASMAPGSGAPDYSVAKPNGAVSAVVSDGAGGWYIGGTFTAVGDVPRSRLAHLLANGTVDPAFDPNMGSSLSGPSASNVRALLLSGTTLYAGGDFTRVGSGPNLVVRNRLAAIDTTTGLATSFDAHLTTSSDSEWVGSLVLSGSRLWAGGVLGSNPLYHNLIAVDRTTGTVDPISEHVSVLPTYPATLATHNGKLYIGGPFTSVNGVARNRLAAIDESTGVLDATFNPNVNNTVTSVQFFNEKLYAGGAFTLVNGNVVPRSGLAAFSLTDGSADPSFNPSVTGAFGVINPLVDATALSGSTLYVAGNFSTIGGSTSRNNLAAIDLMSGSVTAFDPNVDSSGLAIATDGSRVYAGGFFSFAGPGTIARGVAALKPDGTLDTAFQANIGPSAPFVATMTVSSGRVYIGADGPIIVGGVARNCLVALDATTGALVTAFDPNVGNGVKSIVVSGAKVYAGGGFTSVNGSTARNRLAAFDVATGAVDPTFVPSMNNNVTAIALSPGGKVYAAGRFTTVNGTARNGLAAVDATTGALDPGFAPAGATDIGVLALSGSTLYAAGSFTTFNGVARGRVAAVDANTGATLPFAPFVQGTVVTMALDGPTMYLGGGFSAVNSVPRSSLAAVDLATGTVDPGLNETFNGTISPSVNAVLPSGSRLLVGGFFTEVGGKLQMSLARFARSAEPAPSAITGAPSAVTSTSANLAGQVNPSGQQTSYTFEYGTSTAFGAISTVVALDDADALEAVSASLSGLAPGTTYYYRVVATNASGSTFGSVGSFTTSGGVLPPAAATGAASGVTSTSATLSGMVDPQGSPTAFAFDYGTTPALGSLSAVDSAGGASGAQAVSLPITGLSPSTTYYFRIVAANGNGTTTGTIGTFTTGAAT